MDETAARNLIENRDITSSASIQNARLIMTKPRQTKSLRNNPKKGKKTNKKLESKGALPRTSDDCENESTLRIDVDQLAAFDLSTLQWCLYCFRNAKAGAREGKEIATELGTSVKTLTNRIRDFEASVNAIMRTSGQQLRVPFSLIEFKQGVKIWRLPNDPETSRIAEAIMFNVAEIVERWSRISDIWGLTRPVVRIGTTLVAARFLIPELVRQFPRIWFDVTQTKPPRLLELGKRKSCDLILTPVPYDLIPDGSSTPFELPLAVIAPRGHWTEQFKTEHSFEPSDLWKEMAKRGDSLCILPDDPSLYPLLDYPAPHKFPKELKILRAGSITLCHAMVMYSTARSPVLSITLPQFLTEDDLERVHIVPVNDTPHPPLGKPSKFLLLRPGKTPPGQQPTNQSRTAAIDNVEAAIVSRLQTLTRSSMDALMQRKWIYHTSILGGERTWIRGQLVWRTPEILSMRESNSNSLKIISGTHSVCFKQGGVRYIFRGRAIQNNSGQFHVLYRARLIGGEEEDGYVYSGFCQSQEEFESGIISGTWHGTFSSLPRVIGDRGFKLGSGFAVVSSHELNVESLNRHARSYRNNHAETLETLWDADRLSIDDRLGQDETLPIS